MEQNENTLSVLKIAPGQHPQQAEIDNDLKALQQAVGGSIGASYPFEDPVAIVYNDDGKLMGLPLNRALRDENGEMYDAVAGTFLVVGLGEEDFASLTPEMAQKYEQLFHQPEAFLKLGNRLLVLPVPDEPPAEKPRTKPPLKVPCCTGGDGSAGRNRTEILQHYDLHHEAVCPHPAARDAVSVAAVRQARFAGQAVHEAAGTTEPWCDKCGDSENRYQGF